MRKLQKKIIFYNRKINYNLKLEAKIFVFLKKLQFKFETILEQYKRLNNKNILAYNRVNKFILRYLTNNRIDKSRFANIRN